MEKRLAMIATGAIDDADYQTRLAVDDDALRELTESVRRDGVLVPILLTPEADGYLVIAGHRRFKAANLVGLQEIPAYIIPADEAGRWSGAFAENMFRQDLTAIEEAAAIVDCLESGRYDVDSLGKALGKSRHWIDDRVMIASWPEDVQEMVHLGGLSCAAARNLAMIGDEVHRGMLLTYARDNGASARSTAAWLQAWEAGKEYRDPGEVPVADPGAAIAPIEPYCPCVICDRKLKMIELHYSPVCSGCSEYLVELARSVRGHDLGGGGGAGGGQG